MTLFPEYNIKKTPYMQFIADIFGNNFDETLQNYWAEQILNNKIDIHQNVQGIFVQLCGKGNIVSARWIYSFVQTYPNLGTIDISEVKLFLWLCEEGQIEIAKWFCTLIPAYKIVVIDNEIIEMYVNDKIVE